MEVEAGKESDSVDFDVDIAESNGNITPTKSEMCIAIFSCSVYDILNFFHFPNI